MAEERRISPALLLIPAAGLAGVVILAVAATAWAAPPTVYTCPICGAEFGTLEELNDHIQTEHPAAEGATIKIELFDAEGQPLTSSSPVELTEGESYTVRLTVTNLSTKAGAPWEATLNIGILAGTAYTTLIPFQARNEYFAPGQTRTFDYGMAVPLGSGGESGDIIADVLDPAGIKLAGAIEHFTILTVKIIYGATIVIGV